jgi:hypothetical protein
MLKGSRRAIKVLPINGKFRGPGGRVSLIANG